MTAEKTSAESRITRIDGYEVGCRLPERIGNSRRFFEARQSLIVRIKTASGVTGWGETWAYPRPAAAIIREQFGPAVLGMDASAPRQVFDTMANSLGYDRRGISFMAISAIDLAVWDAAARLAGKPLHALLGGALRHTIPAYVSGPFMKPGGDPYRDFLEEIDCYMLEGFKAIKLRMGTEPATDGRMIAEVRRRIGDAMPLMVDLNEGFTLRAALDVAERLAPADLIWLEEPIVHDDLPGYRRLSERLPMGLAAGEALFGLNAFRDYLAAGVLDFVQPDLALCGGISEGLRIAALADAFEVPLIPHVWGTPINFNASLHFAAVLPGKRGHLSYPLFEFDPSFNPLRTELASHPLNPDGSVSVPEGPGLGLDLTPERLAPFITDHWTIQ